MGVKEPSIVFSLKMCGGLSPGYFWTIRITERFSNLLFLGFSRCDQPDQGIYFQAKRGYFQKIFKAKLKLKDREWKIYRLPQIPRELTEFIGEVKIIPLRQPN